MNILIIGSLASGKTALAEELVKRNFCKKENFHSIEQNRRDFSDATFSGEMFAWAHFLRQIENPVVGENNIYEFSGTGRNNWNVGEAMKYSQLKGVQKWVVVITAAEENILLERAKKKQYDAPCPYVMVDLYESIDYMNGQLKEALKTKYAFASAQRIVLRTDSATVEECADKLISLI